MATTSELILYRYSPENMDETVLKKLFVGREKLLKGFVKEIENAVLKRTPRFYLIVGPRGIGKSHFLILLYHEIMNKLGSLLIPIKLREEEYSIYRASDLFLRILEEINEDTKEILSLLHEDDIQRACIEKLKVISREHGKRYIVLIENLHELFKQLDTKELKKLRSVFQKYDIFSIIATAPMIFPDISEHDEPFYNFFQIQYLSEFTVDEIKELILKIAEAEKNQKFIENFSKYEPKIYSMAHLTGGSPRLVLLFYELITKEKIENIEKTFFKIIDEHTPYYQEIFQLLTGQKRKIFDIVILSREPLTPKQISEEARIELPTVTTQLKRLEQDGYILSRPMGRYTKYEVRERLFRLWREMRQPFGRKRVNILLEFLQSWYTPEERRELFKLKFELLEAGEETILRDLCYYAEIQPPEYKAEALLKLTPLLIRYGECDEATYDIQQLKEIAAKDNDKKLEINVLLNEGTLLFSEKKYEEALEIFNKVLEINPNDDEALSRKGLTLEFLGRYDEALSALNIAIEINPKDTFSLIRRAHIIGCLQGKFETALNSFNEILKVNPLNEEALSHKGTILANMERYEEALTTFGKILEINPKAEITLLNMSEVLLDLKRYSEAIDTVRKVKDFTANESSKILAILIWIKANIFLNRKTDIISEIESIFDKIVYQEPYLIKYFLEISYTLALDELKLENRGNAIKFLTMAYSASSKLEEKKVNMATITFLKEAANFGLSITKAAVEEIIKIKGIEYQEHIRPVIKAIEIIEFNDIQRFYNLQIEEREIVADIVRKITKSDELLPSELKVGKSQKLTEL